MAIILKKLKGKEIRKENRQRENLWGPLLLLLKIVAVLFIIFSIFHWLVLRKIDQAVVPAFLHSATMTASKPIKQTSKYIVMPGDTLWDIAQRRYPAKQVEQKVQDIVKLNQLQGYKIVPGQAIRLP